jgi:hypothetical protein
MKRFTQLIVVTVAVLLVQSAIYAQATNGRLIGTVTDGTSVIPNATVTVKDNQTGSMKTVVTDDQGAFSVSQLQFGLYTVSVTAKGFKTYNATSLKIDAGQEYSMAITLEVGGVSEVVSVTAGADLINSTNAELSTTISPQQIRELPLNGRNPLALVSLQAGANVTTNSINGSRSSAPNVTRDGLNVQDNFIRTGRFVSDVPTVDDTGEFTLTTQNAGVEIGGGSAQIQLTTPRGGRRIHGNAYEFNRNSKFAANNFFNNASGTPRSFLNRNQFGFSLSGPLPLPHISTGGSSMLMKKGFFFFNHEQFRLAQQATVTLTTLLPQARNGTFTYVGTDGTQRTVNVLTGAGMPLGGQWTSAGGALTVDPIIQSRFLSGLPDAGNSTTVGINLLQDLRLNRSDPLFRHNEVIRADVDINDRNSVNAVYKHNNTADARTDLAAGFSKNVFVSQGGPTDFWVAAWRSTLGDNFSNELRGGYQLSQPFFNDEDHIPLDYLIGANALGVTSPEASFFDQGRTTRYKNFQDNAVYLWGNHSIRFGFTREHYYVTSLNAAATSPTYAISTVANPNTPGLTNGDFTAISAADLTRANNLRYLLAGIIGGATRTANLIDPKTGYGTGPSIDSYDYTIYAGYVSDQWRIRPNLTLNFGLRYDLYTPLRTPVPKYLEPVIKNPDDLLGSLVDPSLVLDIVGKNSGKAGEYFKPDRNNFGPSVSFAYSPKWSGFLSHLTGGGTVIRGGFRVGYVNDEYIKAASTLVAANPGLGAAALIARDPNLPAASNSNLRSALTPRGIFSAVPTMALPTVTALPITALANNTAGAFTRTLFGVDPHLQVQKEYEWNFGIQRNFLWGTVVEARYVGNKSNSAVRTTDYNQIDMTSNGFLADFNRAHENCRLQGLTTAGGATAYDPAFFCTSAAYNPAIPGSQPLTVFSNLVGAGSLTSATNLGFIRNYAAASLAREYIRLRQIGPVKFQPTTDNGYALEILVNGGRYIYNALQTEIRRRFSDGLYFQANYTFQKTLTNVLSDVNADQNRQGTILDNNRPNLNYGRADYDRTHTFNANMIYELPFGKGKSFLNHGGWVDKVVGGFQLSNIITWSSGPPLSIIDPRATFNTRGNTRQGARSILTPKEIKDLTGIFNTPNGIYYINPSILNVTIRNAATNVTQTGFDLTQQLPAGFTIVSVRAASPIDQAPFPNQKFFFNKAGEVGNLPTNFLNGMPYFNWDAGLSKSFNFKESMRLQIRWEVFNVLNHQVPNFSADMDINSNNFGKVTGTFNGARVMQFGARFDF